MLKKIKYVLSLDFIWKKIIAYTLLWLFFYVLRDYFLVFLLTFLFWYMSYKWAVEISKFIKKIIKKDSKIIKLICSVNFIVSILYVFYIFLFIFFISHLVPLLISEITNLTKNIPWLNDYIKWFLTSLHEIQKTQETVSSELSKAVNEKNISIFLNTLQHIKIIWWWIMHVFLSFILSYFFVIDRKKLNKYLLWLKTSSLKFLYNEYDFLFKHIAKWFFLIFRAQFKIALVNTLLTFLWLHIISFIIWQTIPYIFMLTLLVFFLSFIPVLWTILSSLPIALIIYNIAWIYGVLYIVIMIMIIHIIEAYILNPRFISEEVELPVSLTFLLLLLWEYIFWWIWLIIIIPLFYIIINLLKDIDYSIKNNKWN